MEKTVQECSATCIRLMAELGQTKRDYLNGKATQDAVYQAADAYIVALKLYKKAKKDRRLIIPNRVRLVNWA